MTDRVSRRLVRALLVAGALAATACAAFREPAPQVERALVVTATAYNAAPDQTLGDPERGAWGDKLSSGSRAIAVSPDLLALGLRRGMRVRIEGLPGEWTVLDKMPRRWTRRIDIFMGRDVGAARQWGKRVVRIQWTEPASPAPAARSAGQGSAG
jgi:3D (Asp-Asp-Asp) domain-containing protein